MGKTQTCILCQIVYSSKQEMDEHMRSMLHHRELENLKGRDCGHECRTCGVSVVSLTEYADHISSPLHKQRVEDHDRQASSTKQDEEYFDKEMIELIKKRKELIRQEEAALRRVREEKELRKWQDMENQWQDQRPWLQQQGGPWGWQHSDTLQSSRSGGPPYRQDPRSGPNFDRGNWNSWENRSATWHAEGPPDLQRWESFNGQGGGLHNQGNFWGGRTSTWGGFPPHQRKQSFWVNKEANKGNHERSNDSHWKSSKCFGNNMPLVNHYSTPSKKHHPPQRPHHSFDSQKNDYQSQEATGGESNHCKGSKTEKKSRWAPYPPAVLGDPASQSDNQASSENLHRRSSEYSKDKSLNEHSHGLEGHPDLGSKTTGKINRPNQTSSTSCSSSSFSHRTDRHTKYLEKRLSGSVTNLSQASSQDSVNSKASKHYHSNSDSSKAASFKEQERMLTDMLRQAKEGTLLKKPISEEKNKSSSKEPIKDGDLHSKDYKLMGGSGQSRAKKQFMNKTKMEKVRGEREFLKKNIKPVSRKPETTEQSHCSPQDTNLSVQSLQVSTSTMDRDDEDCGNGEEDLSHIQVTLKAVDESLGSDNEGNQNRPSVSATGSTVPPLSKLTLPSSLKRDLNRHISTKSKGVSHEPNLNIARRIRNVSGPRKSESEKDSVLKPTLRQLIGSSASRRNVNWDHVYQEVHRKKQEQGKGLPRFGIEMVPNEPECPIGMEDDNVPLYEGFHWDSIINSSSSPASPRKRSMSESSVVTNSTKETSSLLKTIQPLPVRDLQDSSKQSPQSIHSTMEEDYMTQKPEQHMEVTEEQRPVQDPEPVDEESSCISGTELNDLQNGGKKRRAAGDVVSPEIPNSERKNKRLKIKPKKERSQFDELLTVSLREEELNSSLQAVDNSLIQARAALQTAYIEVQRLLLVKQQVTTEMSSLRTQRIEILQGLQGDVQYPQRARSCDENPNASAVRSLPFSTLPEDASKPSNPAVSSLNLSTSPASSPVVAIKQERLSPVALTPTRDPTDSLLAGPHSTTPEQSAAVLIETDMVPNENECPMHMKNGNVPLYEDFHWDAMIKPLDEESSCISDSDTFKCDLKVEKYPRNTECAQNGIGMSASMTSLDDGLPPSPADRTRRRASQEETLDLHSPLISESISHSPVSSKPSPPPASQEAKASKRVRKLKKKRVLRNMQSSKQSDISDSELDTNQPTRPQYKLRPRRRPSGSSSSPAATEEKEESMDTSVAPDITKSKQPAVRPSEKESQNSESSDLEMVELPLAVPTEVVNLDSSDPDEGSVKKETSFSHVSKVSDLEKTEGQKLACNEVTSTSEFEIKGSVKISESVQKAILTRKEPKSSSDASSDPGDEDMPTEGSFEGHQEAVNSMQIHNGLLFTCSGDRTVRAFNLKTRKCVAVFEGHSSKVNCLVVSSGPDLPQRLYSGSSDQTIRCYNIKTQECVQQLSLPDRVLCIHNRWKVLFAGLGNGSVVTFSLKSNKQLDVFECHGPRAVSCLATAQEGARRVLLVGSYDSTISVRDAKSGLLLRTLKGHTKTVLCMKVVNDLVFSGSSDQCVHAHNIHTGELVRIYKGHSHAVTVVAILGKVMVTACLDKLVRVYELQSHNRLQVYGGHSDMVLCMVIHKSMIYTGCYNGSVQAVRLNVIQNYRCWWHGCTLIFGVMEHLQQHLLNDHTKPTQQALKCRWRNCDSYITSRNGFKQAVHDHLQKHTEEDSKLES